MSEEPQAETIRALNLRLERHTAEEYKDGGTPAWSWRKSTPLKAREAHIRRRRGNTRLVLAQERFTISMNLSFTSCAMLFALQNGGNVNVREASSGVLQNTMDFRDVNDTSPPRRPFKLNWNGITGFSWQIPDSCVREFPAGLRVES